MSHFGKFVTEGNEKADDLAKEGAMLDEGFMPVAGAKAVQQEREEVYAALQCAAGFHCLVEEWKDSRKKVDFCGPEKKKRSVERSGVQKRESIDA